MKPAAIVEGFIAEKPFPVTSSGYDYDGKSEGAGSEKGRFGGLSAKNGIAVVDKHIDVHEEEGWITIPCKELPDCWSEEPDMLSFRSLDRPFVFPGEQVHILACLSAYKQDIEIITPFNFAEAMNKNGIGQNTKKQNGEIEQGSTQVPEVELSYSRQNVDQNANDLLEGKNISKNNVAGESLLRTEEYRRWTEVLLQRFRNSHFFARIAEADEPLWSKRKTQETFQEPIRTIGGKFIADDVESSKDANKKPPQNVLVDRESLDASTSGGVASSGFKCSLLANGDIVVLLQVRVGVNFLKDPVLEILQFEEYQERTLTSGSLESLVRPNQDPCGDLLKWLLPLENCMPRPVRSLSPPQRSSSSSIRSSDTKPNLVGSSGSQKSLLGHFRSHSMSSIPPSIVPPPTVSTSSPRPNSDLEDWDQFPSKEPGKIEKGGGEGLLSFRGVTLVPERFSVRCGLEGLYVPGRRWRRTVEIIQPIEIRSFVANCNTEDLLCVQIKNVSPAHAPDIVIYLDAVTVVDEEASKGGPPSSLPIACIEAGTDHVLPDLALRTGEEHSFILKPATSLWRGKHQCERTSRSSQLQAESAASSVHGPSNIHHSALPADKYAVLVSFRCNYTESRLFFKQPTSWRPHIPRDLLISVASHMSRKTLGSDDRVPQLPVQVLTLQASNLTSEDLTLTVLAPASFTSPSVVSLNSSPASPMNPFDASFGSAQRVSGDSGPRPGSSNEQKVAVSDVLPKSDLGCTHLWLQSRVPLGCVPSRSTATIKLELLPLTNGIITLDSLRINVEKGLTYIPEHPLKINATSSISTGII